MQALRVEHSTDLYQTLYEAYAEKHRHYHTQKHIDAMLKHFDAVSDLAIQPAELELAIWFHDAVYKPLSKSNELESAQWAKQFLSSCNYDLEGQERVFKLIMATEHNGHIHSNDEKLVVDIDLTILGTPPDIYDVFEENVRKEYRLVPWFIYRKKRKEILKSFLNRPSIYQTQYFIDKFEETARVNISSTIAAL
ncbi:MAG: N-methyl-D-aspartate receptor NMDAR2C subunit [Xanthomonadales bacterium]|nr:N-methyl-D-aspartate receptor NMDAR2C subunit [Xanthomonadales bacterium]